MAKKKRRPAMRREPLLDESSGGEARSKAFAAQELAEWDAMLAGMSETQQAAMEESYSDYAIGERKVFHLDATQIQRGEGQNYNKPKPINFNPASFGLTYNERGILVPVDSYDPASKITRFKRRPSYWRNPRDKRVE